MEAIAKQNNPTAIYYPTPLPLLSVYEPLGYSAEDFPVASRLFQTIFSLPMHPYLTDEELAGIADVLLRVAR